MATIALPMAANSICHPVAVKGSTFICHLCDNTEPTDQLNDENSRVPAASSGMIPNAERS